MAAIRPMEELDCEEMKSYCRWEGPATSAGPNGPTSCEGSYCAEAYKLWYEEHAVTCDGCGVTADIDDCYEYTDNDWHKNYLCGDCHIRRHTSTKRS